MTLDPSNRIVQGFWHGLLTTMERLSMQSFVQNGHEFHLYVYDGNTAGVPDSVHLRDAAEIVPQSEMETFRCAQQFSDFFRIALLLKKGGWYSDLDNVLLSPLHVFCEYAFYRDHDESTISFALSKAPAGSPIMRHCYDYLSQMSSEERAFLPWQAIGSDFACGAVEYFKLTGYTVPGQMFDPIHWTRVHDIINPDVQFDLSQSYSVHLFHAAWNKGPEDRTGKGFDLGHRTDVRLNTDGHYSYDCLYEQLKRRYLNAST
jgi:hypothetical protein